MSDQLIFVKIHLVGCSIFEGQLAIHGMSNTINNTTLNHILSCIFIYHNTAIYGTPYLFHNWLSIVEDHIKYFGNIGRMAKIGSYSTMNIGFCCSPIGFFLDQFQYSGIPICFVFMFLPYGVFYGTIKQFQTKINRILACRFRHFVKKSLFGPRRKIGSGCPPSSSGNIGWRLDFFGRIIFNGPGRESVWKYRTFW